ncbi:MAG: type IX secretion system protein PorQ [Bacteroidia bacterium]
MPHFRILFLAFMLAASTASAQTGGQNVFATLDLPMSARAAALGGKAIGINDNDIHLATWNPALLNEGLSDQLGLSFADYFTDVKYGFATYTHSMKGIGTFGLTFTRVDFGDFIETDNTGAIVGEFSAGEYGINLAYARPIDSLFTIGGTIKYINSNLYLWRADGIAVDLAANYNKPSRNFSASVILRNIGMMTSTYTAGNKEKLPFEIEAGFSKKPKHMPFRLCVTLQHLQKWDLTYIDPNNPPQLVDPLTGDSIKVSKFRSFGDKAMRHVVVGGELLLGKALALRVGYNYMRRKELAIDTKKGTSGFTFGMGLRISMFNFSYARSLYHLAGGTNTFSLTLNLGQFYGRNSRPASPRDPQ